MIFVSRWVSIHLFLLFIFCYIFSLYKKNGVDKSKIKNSVLYDKCYCLLQNISSR